MIEIKAPAGDYDYQNKYFGNAVKYDCPAELPQAVTEAVQAACEKAFAVWAPGGWGRLNLMMRPDGMFCAARTQYESRHDAAFAWCRWQRVPWDFPMRILW